MQSRYLISHPVINKESYIETDSIKSALITVDGEINIINQSPTVAIDYSFPYASSIYRIYLNPYSFYVLSLDNALSEKNINTLATKLYRIHTSQYNKVVYGDALLFGSLDPLDIYSSEEYHSIPYEMLEQLFLLQKIDEKF